MVELCLSPSEATDDKKDHGALGEVAEKFIKRNYCAFLARTRPGGQGCEEFLKPGIPQKPGTPQKPVNRQLDFFDVGMGFHRCTYLATYLGGRNPGIDYSRLGAECISKKKTSTRFAVPDIISHVPGAVPGGGNMGEFYEIKPNSDTGRRQGKEKIDWFADVIARYKLPYLSGDKYTPNEKELVLDGTNFGIPIQVSIHYWHESTGLLLYEFCFKIDRDTYEEAWSKSWIQAAVVLVIFIFYFGTKGRGLQILDDILPPLSSPLRASVGDDAQNDRADVAYAWQLYFQYQIYHSENVAGPWLCGTGPTVPGTLAGSCDPDALQAIRRFSPSGRLDPGGPGIRDLERELLRAVLSSPVQDSLAFLEADSTETAIDEESDPPSDSPIDPVEAASGAVETYLQGFAAATRYWEPPTPPAAS
jgi:hypothetical protein